VTLFAVAPTGLIRVICIGAVYGSRGVPAGAWAGHL